MVFKGFSPWLLGSKVEKAWQKSMVKRKMFTHSNKEVERERRGQGQNILFLILPSVTLLQPGPSS